MRLVISMPVFVFTQAMPCIELLVLLLNSICYLNFSPFYCLRFMVNKDYYKTHEGNYGIHTLIQKIKNHPQ